MATIAELKSDINTDIRSKTAAGSILKGKVADAFDATLDYVAQEVKAKVLKKTITHSELLNMSTVPVVLLPADANKAYVPSAILIKFNNNDGFSDGGTTFNINIKNNSNSTSLGTFSSQLGGTSFLEQFRTLTSGSPSNIADSLFNRRVEVSTSTNPSGPVDNTTTITFYLVYTEIAL
jgi:hypothetical protein